MHRIVLAAVGFTLSAGAAFAQPMPSGAPTASDPAMGSQVAPPHAMRGHSGAMRRGPMHQGAMRGRAAATGSDAAYNGGGVILEGPPGAPAPMPQAVSPMGGSTVVQVPASGMSQAPMRGAPMR